MCKDCGGEKNRYGTCLSCRRARYPAYVQTLKNELFDNYGYACACCGESRREFLCLDHINGGGNEERRGLAEKYKAPVVGGIKFYEILKRRDWPSGYRTLCYNCNMAIHLGTCPHEAPAFPRALSGADQI